MEGKTLGPYRVISKIGEGGMGEVYRARDSRLGRDVAIKVLPEAFAADGQRLARFQREAQLLAALNHPNIAAIYGLEGGARAGDASHKGDAARDGDTTRFSRKSGGVPVSGIPISLVMELVEGPTLLERLTAGSPGRSTLPLEETLPIARQIAEALEYAHEKGIIHRDLKPANIKFTADGAVKILDFGLAKAMEGEAPAIQSSASISPTLSLVATQAGMILGTAGYMSPEQAKGKPVDRRADIWSFGVLLYEMLTGRALYTGETAAETMAHVITREPDWEQLPADVPTHVRLLLRRCLTKDPRERLRDIGEARIALGRAASDPQESASAPALPVPDMAPTPLWRRAASWASLAAFLGIGLVVAVWAPWRPATRPSPPIQLDAGLGVAASLRTDYGPVVLSHDGSRLAYAATGGGSESTKIFLRRLDQLTASPMNGTEGGRDPFFSHDGEWLGFFAADGKLKKISVNGGAAVTLCDATDGRGGSWGDDGFIVFAATNRTGLSRVSSAGGKPMPLSVLDTEAGEVTHRWPQVLRGSQLVLYTAHTQGSNFDEANIVIQPLAGGACKIVQRGGLFGRYLPSGHLVYVNQGTLFAAPFDLGRLEMTAQPVPALEGVFNSTSRGSAQLTFSDLGMVAYLPGRSVSQVATISWIDGQGKRTLMRSKPSMLRMLNFSPDGRRVAMEMLEGSNMDVWVYEWERDTLMRLTFAKEDDMLPVWTPDGRRITFQSDRAERGRGNLYWKPSDGTGEEQRLTESKNLQGPSSWHPTGKFLAFFEQAPVSGYDLMILPMEGSEAAGWKPGNPNVFLATPYAEYDPMFSPDGRFLAYASNETGRPEVYVRPFPGPGGKWQVSGEGGQRPLWTANGKELFFRNIDDRIMVASFRIAGNSFQAEKPRLWTETRLRPATGGGRTNFSLHPDGQRFAMVDAPGEATAEKRDHLVFIMNYFDELRRLAPAVGGR